MKSLNQFLKLFLMSIIIISCTSDEYIDDIENRTYFKSVTAIDDNLSRLINHLEISGTFLRTVNSEEGIQTEFGTLKLDQIIERIVNTNEKQPTYSIKIIPSEILANQVEYLILTPKQEKYYGYIIQFSLDAPSDRMSKSIFDSFNGTIRILNFKREILSEEFFANGVQIDKPNTSSRTQTTYSDCDCKYVLEPVYGPVTGEIIGHDIVIDCECSESGGSGSSGGDGGNTGGIGEPIAIPGDRGSGGSGSGGGSGETIGFEDVANAEILVENIEFELQDLTLPQLRQQYAGRMSEKELEYFDNNLSSSQQLTYLQNAYRAEETIRDLAPETASLHNDKWDALRHAYLHGLSSENLSITISQKLGDLHEDWVGNPPDEKDMDLFNNQKGRDTYTQLKNQNLTGHFYKTGLLISLINLMNSGGLKQIKNGILTNTP